MDPGQTRKEVGSTPFQGQNVGENGEKPEKIHKNSKNSQNSTICEYILKIQQAFEENQILYRIVVMSYV